MCVTRCQIHVLAIFFVYRSTVLGPNYHKVIKSILHDVTSAYGVIFSVANSDERCRTAHEFIILVSNGCLSEDYHDRGTSVVYLHYLVGVLGEGEGGNSCPDTFVRDGSILHY